MADSLFARSSFRPLPLFAGIAFSLLLFGSWAFIDTTRTWWDALDHGVFFTLNGSLEGHRWWQAFWAIGNNRIFDFISALLLLTLLYRFIMDDDRQYATERVAIGLFMGLGIGLTALAVDALVPIVRESPSLVLKPVTYLSDHITWLKTKDRSGNSFPGDHATVLCLVTLFFWFFAGKRYGKWVLALAIFFALPRIVAGAHWFTDVAVGAVSASLFSASLLLFTPLHRWIIAGLVRMLQLPFFQTAMDIVLHEEVPSLVAKGGCMGTADIIPGVSGGTVAYILGIWHRLIEAIKSFDLPWFKRLARLQLTEAMRTAHLHFLIPLLFGIALAVVAFTKLIPVPYLLEVHPEPVYGLFFGLIAGSILLLLMELGRLCLRDGIMLIIGIFLGWSLVTLVPVQTPETGWFVFLSGCIAISAMLLPGISGSFILLILGKYAYVLGALGALDFAVILPFIAGCLVGVMAFSRLVSWLLHHYYRISVLVITGILTGSLWMIWPFQLREYVMVRDKPRLIASHPHIPESFTGEQWLALALAIIGFGLVMLLHRTAQRKKHPERKA